MLRELICEEIKRNGEKETFKPVHEGQRNRLKDGLEERTPA